MTYTPTRKETMPIPVEPAVLGIHLVAPSGATGDIPIYIPWKHCKLVYGYTVTTVAEGNQGAVDIDLELNAASGTAMMSVDVAQNAAVGDLDEGSIDTQSACDNLSSDDSARDQINIEITGASSTTWEGMLYLYFEVWEGE